MSGLFFPVGVLMLGFSFLSGFLENMMLVYCLFPWSAQLVCSQEMITGIGGGILDRAGENEVGRECLCDSLGIGLERKGRLQLVSSHRDRKESVGLDVRSKGER